jgi:hypothetical protein
MVFFSEQVTLFGRLAAVSLMAPASDYRKIAHQSSSGPLRRDARLRCFHATSSGFN